MKRKHRNHSPGFKAKVAVAALKGDKTLAEISTLMSIPFTQEFIHNRSLLSVDRGPSSVVCHSFSDFCSLSSPEDIRS